MSLFYCTHLCFVLKRLRMCATDFRWRSSWSCVRTALSSHRRMNLLRQLVSALVQHWSPGDSGSVLIVCRNSCSELTCLFIPPLQQVSEEVCAVQYVRWNLHTVDTFEGNCWLFFHQNSETCSKISTFEGYSVTNQPFLWMMSDS